MTATGTIAAQSLVRLESAIHAYESAVKSACLPIRQCTYSGDALSQTIDKRSYYSNDLNHFSIEGHARAAAAAWATLLRANVIPKS